MKQTERELLIEARMHLERAQLHAKSDLNAEIVQDAVAMRLVAMIDTLARLTQAALDAYFGEEWPAMRGMRNRIVHGYMSVDPEVIRLTVSEDLADIDTRIRRAIDDSPPV